MATHPDTLKEKAQVLAKYRSLLNSPGKKGKFLRSLLKETEDQFASIKNRAQHLDPLMFFRPSYEQMLMLNAWMYGISFICVYAANRIGKTTAMIIDKVLWIFPNNPKHLIFKPYRVGEGEDALNANLPQVGSLVQVFPRPDISFIKEIAHHIKRRPFSIPAPNPRLPHYHPQNLKVLQWLQKKLPDAYKSVYPLAPWNKGGVIWFGAPDQEHHEKTIMPLVKQYLPERSIERFVTSDREITIKITTPPTPIHPTGHSTVWEWIGKSYESKDTKWSSGAVDIICLTEGVTPEMLKEVKMRFKDPGIGSHDFTPYLPANAGAASALAQRIYKGQEKLPLNHFVFTEFSLYDAPSFVMTKEQKAERIDSFKNDPQGVARLEGKFYSSSALVLSNFNRENNLLPLSQGQFFQQFPNCRLYRGLDPGLDHPTACAWGALLPTNQLVIYRIMSEERLSIQQRCKKIIQLSNNTLAIHKWGHGQNDYYAYEAHTSPRSEIFNGTYCDYHTFKEDEVTGQPYALNYILNGLNIEESVHTGPEERSQLVDNKLQLDPYLPNLITRVPPGPRLMFLRDEPGMVEVAAKWEEFYWSRKASGANRGDPTDKIPSHGDDELDAISYIACAPIIWTPYRPSGRVEGDSEPEMDLIQASQNIQRRNPNPFASTSPNPSGLQSLQNPLSPQIVMFGEIEYD